MRRRLLGALLVALSFLTGAPAFATDGTPAPQALEEGGDYATDGGDPYFVTPPAKPTRVSVGLKVLRLTRIDPPSEPFPTATIEAYLDFEWDDPRLAFDPDEVGVPVQTFLENDAAYELERIWWPAPTLENEVGKRQIEDEELEIAPDGRVHYRERFSATIPLDFDLHKFPFDSQAVTLDLESFAWNEDNMILVPVAEKIGLAKTVTAPGWNITGVTSKLYGAEEIRGKVPFSELHLTIAMDREYWPQLKSSIIPLVIILFVLAVVVFSDLTGRVEYILIALLSFVAFNGLIAEEMPGLSDFIFLDYLILVGYVASLTALVEAVAVQQLHRAGKTAQADRLEHLTQIALPATVGLVILLAALVYI